MDELKFAIIGTGFWARYQLAAWGEVPGVRCVALCDKERGKAEKLAQQFGITQIYDDAEKLLREAKPNFVDIITDVNTHAPFVELCAKYRTPVICQKPMAPDLATARRMVEVCKEANVPFFIHENFRWQTPIQELRKELDSGIIGAPFRARLQFNCSFPVFENQPFLAELEQFIITDVGSHLLDVARFLFGEAQSLYCQTQRINDIRGEDVATIIMDMNGVTVTVELSYASRLEYERFPETFAVIEGQSGSIELVTNFWLITNTKQGALSRRVPPPDYSWADPAYAVVHSSMVPCHKNLLRGLQGGYAETTGEDNLKTVQLVFAAYESARKNHVIHF
ncbi:MAG TPA: Gfo/Idh/MocA family oxidoreductase [Abditibacteriaceae bacterium]|jgi:predicted dehydrogenase